MDNSGLICHLKFGPDYWVSAVQFPDHLPVVGDIFEPIPGDVWEVASIDDAEDEPTIYLERKAVS